MPWRHTLAVRCTILACLYLALLGSAGQAQTTPPSAAPAAPEAFAYTAPALTQELDATYPLPPPVPPWPPRTDGVLHLPSGVLRSFDPTVGYSTELSLVWDTLREWESTGYFPEAQAKPVIRTSLAESWEMVDPSTWLFRLRQGVKFHNWPPVHGREMAAKDVRYAYELLRGKPGYANRPAAIKAVQVVDQYTVRFQLKQPDPHLPPNHVNSFSPVIAPREAVEAEGGLSTHPVGTGGLHTARICLG